MWLHIRKAIIVLTSCVAGAQVSNPLQTGCFKFDGSSLTNDGYKSMARYVKIHLPSQSVNWIGLRLHRSFPALSLPSGNGDTTYGTRCGEFGTFATADTIPLKGSYYFTWNGQRQSTALSFFVLNRIIKDQQSDFMDTIPRPCAVYARDVWDNWYRLYLDPSGCPA